MIAAMTCSTMMMVKPRFEIFPISANGLIDPLPDLARPWTSSRSKCED